MGTHAYVRYEADKRCAIVPVEYVKNFDFRADGDYASTFYFVKWIEEDGSSDYYQARILLLGGKFDLLLFCACGSDILSALQSN